MEQGTVKWFNDLKSYGYILRDSGGEIYVHLSHLSSIRRPLVIGERVEFEVVEDLEGVQAKNVRIVTIK
jgi:CspA family cold shock protein